MKDPTQDKDREAMWDSVCKESPMLQLVQLLTEGPGPKVPRGSNRKRETGKAFKELLKICFDTAFDAGHDIARRKYDENFDESEDPNDVDESEDE